MVGIRLVRAIRNFPIGLFKGKILRKKGEADKV